MTSIAVPPHPSEPIRLRDYGTGLRERLYWPHQQPPRPDRARVERVLPLAARLELARR